MKVGEPVPLTVVAADPDNIPTTSRRRAPARARWRRSTARRIGRALERPRAASVLDGLSAVRPTAVALSPDQLKTWTDSRAYGNSPWSPPYVLPEVPTDGRWETQATFAEPGEYVLRAVASDGSLFTYRNVTIVVTR